MEGYIYLDGTLFRIVKVYKMQGGVPIEAEVLTDVLKDGMKIGYMEVPYAVEQHEQ